MLDVSTRNELYLKMTATAVSVSAASKVLVWLLELCRV